jgi:hypothetical protein
MATYFHVVDPPLSTLLGVALQMPLAIGVVDLEDEDTVVVLLLELAATLLELTEDVSACTDEELAIIGPF